MYLGTITRQVKHFGHYSSFYVRKEFHVYKCDSCGERFEVIGQATEPFYCTCQKLISIEFAAPASQESEATA